MKRKQTYKQKGGVDEEDGGIAISVRWNDSEGREDKRMEKNQQHRKMCGQF